MAEKPSKEEEEAASVADVTPPQELARMSIRCIEDVVLARHLGRLEAARLAFPAGAVTQIATAVSEIARNVVQHAQASGQVRLCRLESGERVGLLIEVSDQGVGIENCQALLVNSGPGAGLAGTRALMDEFRLDSGTGTGTQISMIRWRPEQGEAATGEACASANPQVSRQPTI